MQLPKQLTSVTPLSKVLAMIAFITLPFIGFGLGVRYQDAIQTHQIYQTQVDTTDTLAKIDISPTQAIKVQESSEVKYRYLSKVYLESKNKIGYLYIKNDKESNDVLVINDTLNSDNTEKIIYKIEQPNIQSFMGMVFIHGNYAVTQIGGEGPDVLLFTLDGTVIADNLRKINPQLDNWSFEYRGEIVKDTIGKFYLSRLTGATATVQIDIKSGKMVPGTLQLITTK